LRSSNSPFNRIRQWLAGGEREATLTQARMPDDSGLTLLPVTMRERLQLLLIWFFLGLVPLFLRPLWEPDEARYAEIPREMLATADWLTPRLNGVLYFEKPPLQYWLSAWSMKLFGLNAAAARLPLALATLILLWCAWRLARRLGASQPVWGAFMAATTLLVFVCQQILTLDALFSALLVLSLVAAIEAVAARVNGQGRAATGWTLVTFGANALALLTKGLAAPVLLGGILIWSLPWAWKTPKLRNTLLRLLADPLGWLLFAVIGAPWFILVEQANPGHARFFFIHEHFARFSSHVHSRQGSNNPVLDKLYFVGILLVGLLPWLAASITGLWRATGFLRRKGGPQSELAPLHRWTIASLVLAFAVPLLFFSLSGSKLPPYILPVVVPLLVLACAFEREDEAWASLRKTGWELLLLGAIFTLAGPFLLQDGGLAWTLALGVTLLGLGFWALRPKNLTGPRWMVALGAGLLLLSLVAQKTAGSGKEVSRLVQQAPPDAQWISCGNYFQGLPFYSRQRVSIVAGTGELAFGRDRLSQAERDRWFQDDARTLGTVAQALRAETPARPVWALVSRNAWKDLPPERQQLWEVMDHSPSAWLVRLK
jgi:4-amino-4-deoxy-L-arabinose transferase-like glycosyltransferase